MITMSFDPAIIWLNRPTDVDLVLVNKGTGPCTQVRFRLEGPESIAFARGSGPVVVGRVEHTKPHRESLKLRAREEGVMHFKVTRLTCRNPFGEYEELRDQVLTLTVLRPDRPVLNLNLQKTPLVVQEWGKMEGVIANSGMGVARGVCLGVEAPFEQSGRYQLEQLAPGEEQPFTLRVRVNERGDVPVRISAVYSDESGQEHQLCWDDSLIVQADSSVALRLNYERGLVRLKSLIRPGHRCYTEFYNYEQRLLENLKEKTRHGDTEERRAGRAEVIDHLNQLALETVGKSFNELCQ